MAAAGDVYSDRLAFGARAVGFRQHWKDELALVEHDLKDLEQERAKAAQKPRRTLALNEPGLTPPEVSLYPVSPAAAGQDLRVTARIRAPEGVKWARLRYRHLTQFEDYQTADMSVDAKTGLYTAAIPAAFIDPKWDLMYFVEVVGKNGAGRMYPDLERETPYVIVGVKR